MAIDLGLSPLEKYGARLTFRSGRVRYKTEYLVGRRKSELDLMLSEYGVLMLDADEHRSRPKVKWSYTNEPRHEELSHVRNLFPHTDPWDITVLTCQSSEEGMPTGAAPLNQGKAAYLYALDSMIMNYKEGMTSAMIDHAQRLAKYVSGGVDLASKQFLDAIHHATLESNQAMNHPAISGFWHYFDDACDDQQLTVEWDEPGKSLIMSNKNSLHWRASKNGWLGQVSLIRRTYTD